MDITDLFSTRIQKTFDEDQAEIVNLLKSNPKRQLKLINYYKGMPLSYSASIVSVDRGVVDLDVRAEQAFAIQNDRSVFIRSPIFKHDVFARLQYVNIKKKAASFVKFSYVEIMAERRNFIRVAPEPGPRTFVESPLGLFEGTLYDISISGINISIPTSNPMEIDNEVQARFMLMNMEQSLVIKMDVPARLIDIKGDKLPRNYRFTMSADKATEQQVSKYIFKRQIEIINEIRESVS